MDHNLYLLCSHILYLLDFNLALVLGFKYGINHLPRCLPVGNFRNGDGVLVNLFYTCANLHHTAALAGHIFGALGEAPGREVRENLVRLTL